MAQLRGAAESGGGALPQLYLSGLHGGKLKLGELADFAILLGWIGVYLAGGWWLTEWKCPRCGKVFGHRIWTTRCISCDLSKEDVAAVARGYKT